MITHYIVYYVEQLKGEKNIKINIQLTFNCKNIFKNNNYNNNKNNKINLQFCKCVVKLGKIVYYVNENKNLNNMQRIAVKKDERIVLGCGDG